ncbi:MAG: hypothetical protein WCS65_08030 [Verrucomicrobiae bacterium]
MESAEIPECRVVTSFLVGKGRTSSQRELAGFLRQWADGFPEN